jgi:hypothetical protein
LGLNIRRCGLALPNKKGVVRKEHKDAGKTKRGSVEGTILVLGVTLLVTVNLVL